MNALCIHGHYYQPPREDPLTGLIPIEPGAEPFPNWNERIYYHCYAPNAELGNFERISFNIGPTLAEWMQLTHADTLAQIVAQDKANVERYGVGNAMAQPYNHTILPLATRADKVTQVRWGIADFEAAFGRKPQGMWLPEAAVDDETMEVLVDHGIQFIILAPWQAAQDGVDVTRPYIAPLADGRSLTVFFYEQDLSMRVSFDPASTVNADRFIEEFIQPRYRHEGDPQILVIASDGELYGHHQPFRDKFLARLTSKSLGEHQIDSTYPARWLLEHPATEVMKVRPNTSWSCHHGVSRWKEACGCTPYGEWKAVQRNALDQIAVALDENYERTISPLVNDVWELRNRYIEVILGQSKVEDLINEMALRELSADETRMVSHLLRAQFERQRAFTSCAWFFEDFDRIEPRNNVTYAAHAVWLNEQATGQDLLPMALDALRPLRSWRTGLRGDEFFQSRYEVLRTGNKATSEGVPAAAV